MRPLRDASVLLMWASIVGPVQLLGLVFEVCLCWMVKTHCSQMGGQEHELPYIMEVHGACAEQG